MGVFVGAFCAAPFSGAHLNPAVTLAMAAAGKLAGGKVAGYLLAQMLGGIVGGSLVFGLALSVALVAMRMLLVFLVAPVLTASIYVSYRDIFQPDEKALTEPPAEADAAP